MKRIFALLLALSFCLTAAGQAKITTRKEKLADFERRTLKVVLPGQSVLDEALREAARNVWYLSPCETCTTEEFARLRSSDNWYFLALKDVRPKKRTEGGLTYVTLLKGGAKEVDDLVEIARFPLCAAGAPSGREAVLLPALLEAMQAFVKKARSNDLARLGSAVGNLKGTRNQGVWLVRDELSPQVGKDYMDKHFDSSIHLVSAAEADAVMRAGRNALVGFSVRPAQPAPGDECHTYIINARTLEICLWEAHKISAASGAGLLKSDLNALTRRK